MQMQPYIFAHATNTNHGCFCYYVKGSEQQPSLDTASRLYRHLLLFDDDCDDDSYTIRSAGFSSFTMLSASRREARLKSLAIPDFC